jgi:hypothetical protein
MNAVPNTRSCGLTDLLSLYRDMSNVQLYIYDLSNGLARQLSLSLIGKQIDGIWYAS